jgi:hypothetical protein
MGGHDDRHYEELVKDEVQEAKDNAQVIDYVNALGESLAVTPFGNMRPRFFGRTSFEGHRLNDMLDMVEPTAPEQVEEVGTSLIEAGAAILKAADDLAKDVADVVWEGESGEAFKTWSMDLADRTRALADYTTVVGQQITLAGSGLASVRKSMPPRDLREEPKTVAQIPAAKRVDSNEEYVAAVKVERDRQEAINQMIRLASFYAVSEEALAGKEPPTFQPLPAIDGSVPRTPRGPGPSDGTVRSGTDETVVASPVHSGTGASAVAGRVDGTPMSVSPQPLPPSSGASMQIDSVTAPVAPPETARPLPTAPVAVGPTAPGTPVPPYTTGVPPVPTVGRSGGGRMPGGVGSRPTPVTAHGETARPTTGGGGTAAGRSPHMPMGPTGQQAAARGVGGASPRGSLGPMGPLGQTGQPGTAGRAGGVGTGGRTAMGPTGPVAPAQPVTGRPATGSSGPTVGGTTSPHGISGGVQKAVPSVSRGAFPVQGGVTASGGVVGGRPAVAPSGSLGRSGARVPRGTVIGGEAGAARAGAVEQPGRRGVVGAESATPTSARTTSQARMDRPLIAPPGGVTGAPRDRETRNKRRSPNGERPETPPAVG